MESDNFADAAAKQIHQRLVDADIRSSEAIYRLLWIPYKEEASRDRSAVSPVFGIEMLFVRGEIEQNLSLDWVRILHFIHINVFVSLMKIMPCLGTVFEQISRTVQEILLRSDFEIILIFSVLRD